MVLTDKAIASYKRFTLSFEIRSKTVESIMLAQ